MFSISLDQLWDAYYEARRHKRYTIKQVEFEANLNCNILKLYNELITGTYEISPSTCFIVKKPKPREVFAANFRDRIVHHLVISELMPLFKRDFIENSFSCIKGKGNLYGVLKCREAMLRNPDGIIAKFDIKGFFMNIDKNILFSKLETYIIDNFDSPKVDWLLYCVKLIVLNDPTLNCIKNSPDSDWELIEPSKSLFRIDKSKGIAIGNLTSQLFASFYLMDLDNYLFSEFSNDYGRYVDDFYIVADKGTNLNKIISKCQSILAELNLTLHPNKVYMQSVSKGVKFLGIQIKYNRLYLGNRTLYEFRNKFNYYNKLTKFKDIEKPIQSINNYLGFCINLSTYNIRSGILAQLSEVFWMYVYIEGSYKYLKLKTKYKELKNIYIA